MKNIIIFISLALFINGCGESDDSTGVSTVSTVDAKYKITFESAWNISDFPTAFPEAKEHFSGLIGATHTKSSSIWKNGSKASVGIQLMAETGSKVSLKDEISANPDFFLIDGGGISVGSKSVSIEFSVIKEKPLLTLTSMVAPSPDWFVGVSSLNLYNTSENEWIESITIPLKIYDAGTDSGSSFTSENLPTSPSENIKLLSESEVDFDNGLQSLTTKAIGTFKIERL